MPISAMIIDVKPEFKTEVVNKLEQLEGVEIYFADVNQKVNSIKGRIIVTTDTRSNEEDKLVYKKICNLEHVLTANYAITANDEVLNDADLVTSIDKKIEANNI